MSLHLVNNVKLILGYLIWIIYSKLRNKVILSIKNENSYLKDASVAMEISFGTIFSMNIPVK